MEEDMTSRSQPLERSPSALPAEAGVSGNLFWSAVYWAVRVPMIVLQIGWEPPWRWANRLHRTGPVA